MFVQSSNIMRHSQPVAGVAKNKNLFLHYYKYLSDCCGCVDYSSNNIWYFWKNENHCQRFIAANEKWTHAKNIHYSEEMRIYYWLSWRLIRQQIMPIHESFHSQSTWRSKPIESNFSWNKSQFDDELKHKTVDIFFSEYIFIFMLVCGVLMVFGRWAHLFGNRFRQQYNQRCKWHHHVDKNMNRGQRELRHLNRLVSIGLLRYGLFHCWSWNCMRITKKRKSEENHNYYTLLQTQKLTLTRSNSHRLQHWPCRISEWQHFSMYQLELQEHQRR